MIRRTTAAGIRAAVAVCKYRSVPAPLAGAAFGQSETSRGEPRAYYVLCAQAGGQYQPCKCAHLGTDPRSQEAANARAAVVVEQRRRSSRQT